MNRQKMNSLFNKSSFWQTLAVLLLFASFLTLLILFLNPVSAQNEDMKTISLNVKSDLQANYQADARQGFLPNISLRLVKEMISNNSANGEADPEYQAFLQSLNTLVPTVIPDPNMVPMNTDMPEPTSSLTLTVTMAPTLSVTVTETETGTVTPTKSATPWIVTLTWTPWPDGPRVNPPQPKPPATITPVPPTAITPPTDTPIPPTDTVPPTAITPPTFTPTSTTEPTVVAPPATSTDAPRGRPPTKTPKPDDDDDDDDD